MMVMEPEFIKISKIAPNPINPKDVDLTEQQRKSFKDKGILEKIKLRPRLDTDPIDKKFDYVIVDGDHRFRFQQKTLPKNAKLVIGVDVEIKQYSTLLEAFTDSCHLNEVRKSWSAKEWFKFFDIMTQLKPDAKLDKLSEVSGAALSTISEYRKCWKNATEEEKKAILAGELSVRQWARPEKNFAGEISTSGHVEEESSTPLLDKYRPENDVAPEDGAMQSITKPPKYICPTEFFDDLQEAFPHEEFIDVKMVGAYTGFTIVSANENTHTRLINLIQNLHEEVQEKVEAKKSRSVKKEGPEEDRTTYFTQEQFEVIKPQLDEHEYQSYQTIDDHVNVLWRNDQLHYNAIQWILNNKDKFPLDEFQLKQYTDLKPVEIEEVLEREVSDSEPCFIDVSQKEYDSFTEEIKYLISKEEKQKGGSKRVWFRTWVDNQRAFDWLNPSQEWEPCVLDFPAKTFKKTNLQDILIDVKKSFPILYQELRELQKLTKTISPIPNTTIMEIISTTSKLRVPHNNFVDQLLLIKKRRRIDNGREEHKKICDKCLQPKWMGPQQILCGNCEYQERQQKKKSAAATSSGGRA